MKNELKNTYIKVYEHKYKVKGKEVTFNKERRFSSITNQLVYDYELDNAASEEAIKIYNQLYGIEASKITNLRKQYDLSIELFAKIIGCAKKTLISYEKGTSIPNDIYMISIKTLLDNPEVLVNMIQSNKERFSDKEYKKIIERLDGRFGPNINKLFLDSGNELSIYNGFTEPNLDKIKNLFLILCETTIQKTKLLKEMFYIDFTFYKKNGSSITGLEYAKLDYGPVPDDFNTLISNFIEDNIIENKVEFESNYEKHNIIAKKSPDYSVFDELEIANIKEVIKRFENYTVEEIVKYSHKEKAFKETEYYKNISYDHAFDLQK